MSKVVSMRLPDAQAARLERYARTLGKSSGETGAMLVEENLRQAEFAFIEFRPSPIGRQAYMKGSRLPVWWVIRTDREAFGMDAQKLADHLGRPLPWVQAAFNYYAAYSDEIEQAISDHGATSLDALQRALPGMQVVSVPVDAD